MKTSLFLETLLSLESELQDQFLKFIQSPYFNTDPKLVTLLQWVLTQPTEEITREASHDLLFPGQAFDYDRITNYLSYLQRHLEKFLALEAWQEDGRQPLLWGMKAAQTKGLSRLFNRLEGKWRRYKHHADRTAESQMEMQQEVELLRNQQLIRLGKRKDDSSLERRVQILRERGILSRLSNACHWLTIRQVVGQPQTGELDNEIEALLSIPEQAQSHALINLYHQILTMMVFQGKPEHYHQFRSSLNELSGFEADRKTLFQYAQNYCIQRANRGDTSYLQELFGLYRQMLKEGMLYEQNKLSLSDIKNIVSLGVRLKEFDWTRDFLLEQQEHFPLVNRQAVIQYNTAYLVEAEAKPSEALRLLRGVEFEDIFYQLGARIILVKCFYQMRDLEGLESMIHAFSTWLRRNKQVSTYQRKVHLNLLRFIRKLAFLRAKLDLYSRAEQALQLDRLENKIRATKEITNIGWILEELERLR